MTTNTSRRRWPFAPWRLALWGGAAALLTAPAIAMRFTRSMNWGVEDFAAMAVLLLAACIGIEVAMRFSSSRQVRAGLALLVMLALVLVWAHLAVGVF